MVAWVEFKVNIYPTHPHPHLVPSTKPYPWVPGAYLLTSQVAFEVQQSSEGSKYIWRKKIILGQRCGRGIKEAFLLVRHGGACL